MACWGAVVAMAECDAGKFTLVRFEAHAHNAPKMELGLGAKVGYCPCCTRATHIACPPMC